MTSLPTQPPEANLFDPAGVTWQRVDLKLIKVRLAALLLIGLPILAVALLIAVANSPAWLWALPAAIFTIICWLLFLIPRQVRAIGYAERAEDLLIRKGVMFRRMSIVPYGRMQYVDVNAGPIARAFGIAKVQLHTASPSSDAQIPGLPVVEADRLRDTLASRGQARLAGL